MLSRTEFVPRAKCFKPRRIYSAGSEAGKPAAKLGSFCTELIN